MGNKEAKKSAPTELTSDHPLTRDIEHCDDSGEDVTISKSIADEISVERTRKQKTRHTLRTVSKVAFTQLGFGGLIVGYVILGALMFDAIESPYELGRLQEKQRNRQHFVHQLYIHAYQEFNRVLNQTFELKYALWRGGVSRHDEQNNGWKIDIEKDVWERFIDYELLRYLGPGETDLYGKDEQQLKHNTFQVWTFASSIFYSITLITTIGYGNIAPKTNAGKIATMVYAMFGIPLMFMYLIYTGGLLADAFISVYSKMVNSFCRRLKPCLSKTPRPNSDESDNDREEPRHVPIVATLVVLLFYIAIGASLFAQWEHWHMLDAAYFCFITLTTIGLGDCVPSIGTATGSMASKAVICSFFLLFGLVLMVMSFKLMQHEIISKSRRIVRHFGFRKRHMNDSSGSTKNGRQEN